MTSLSSSSLSVLSPLGCALLGCVLALGCGPVTVGRDDGQNRAGGAGLGTESGSGGTAGTGDTSMPSAGGTGGGSSSFVPSPDCNASPARYTEYASADSLDALLIRRWKRCVEPQINGEEVGVEFADDGYYYPLYVDEAGNLARRTGVDFAKRWAFMPGPTLGSWEGSSGSMLLDGTTTNGPQFTEEPVQMRILFTPAIARYTPLD